VEDRLLLDENIENEATDRLTAADHDAEHVDSVPTLGKGASDAALARYSVETDRTIVTYDDDFIARLSPGEYHSVLFFEDESVTVTELVAIIDAMARVYQRHRSNTAANPPFSGTTMSIASSPVTGQDSVTRPPSPSSRTTSAVHSSPGPASPLARNAQSTVTMR